MACRRGVQAVRPAREIGGGPGLPDRGGERPPGCDQQLRADQVHIDGFLGRGVLDLQPGVDLQEGQLTGGREQEFDGPGVDVARLAADGRGHAAERGPLIGGQERRGRLLDDFLVTTLQRAVTGARHQDGTVGVRKDLHLDVPPALDVGLGETLAPAERGRGFADRGVERGGDLVSVTGDAQATAAAAVRRLDRDGQPVLLGEPGRRRGVGDGMTGARHQRRAGRLRDGARLHLVAQRADDAGRRPDPGRPASSTAWAKLAFSARKPYPGWTASAPVRSAAARSFPMLRYVSAGLVPANPVASSARTAKGAPSSGSAYTAMLAILASRQARTTRSAISPRLAISTRLNSLVPAVLTADSAGPAGPGGSAARASTARAIRTCTSSTICPPTTPTPSAPAATTARACATSSGVGVNTSWASPICRG